MSRKKKKSKITDDPYINGLVSKGEWGKISTLAKGGNPFAKEVVDRRNGAATSKTEKGKASSK